MTGNDAIIEISDTVGDIAVYRVVCSCKWVGQSSFYIHNAFYEWRDHWRNAVTHEKDRRKRAGEIVVTPKLSIGREATHE